MIEVRVLHVAECPNAPVALERVRDAITGRSDTTLTVVEVADEDEAARLGMHGSPTIIVNGTDPFAAHDAPTGMACRFRPGGDPVPTVDEIRAALNAP